MNGPTITLPGVKTVIDQYNKVTPASIYAVEGEIRQELHKPQCNAQGLDGHGWQWILYADNVWKNMDGVCKYDATTGAKIAGNTVTSPPKPGTNTSNNFAQLVAFQEKEKNYANYQVVLTWTQDALEYRWKYTGHFADKKNKAGIINNLPQDLLTFLKDNWIKGSTKDNVIDEAQERLKPGYNPNNSIQNFCSKFKVAREELEELGEPPKEKDMIRNALNAI